MPKNVQSITCPTLYIHNVFFHMINILMKLSLSHLFNISLLSICAIKYCCFSFLGKKSEIFKGTDTVYSAMLSRRRFQFSGPQNMHCQVVNLNSAEEINNRRNLKLAWRKI